MFRLVRDEQVEVIAVSPLAHRGHAVEASVRVAKR